MNAPRLVLKKIAVIDSGSGGTTILRALEREISHAQFIFKSDFENFPYGTKSDQEVINCSVTHALAVVKEHNPDILVVACNTASTVALKVMREKIQIPVVGVVPAIKSAAQVSVTKEIGLLATSATVSRPYIDQLISDFASECVVLRHGANRLVALAEEKAHGGIISLTEVEHEIRPLFCNKIDAIVLGCTHFPLLIDELKAVAPWPVHWIDSSAAIVRRVRFLLNI